VMRLTSALGGKRTFDRDYCKRLHSIIERPQLTASPAEVRARMPQHALIEKPFSADHIMGAIRLSLERGDSGCI
jgi:hypothetical protein